jgi:hypothetical protein
MILCACDSEERERGVGAGVNTTVLLETLHTARMSRGSCRMAFFLILGNKKKRVSEENETPP